MRFQVLLSLWSVTSCLFIDKIPEVAKTKVSKREILFIRVKILLRPLKRLIETRPHMSTSRCGDICVRRGFSNCSSVDAAVSGRSCVSRQKQKHFIWPSESRCI